MSKETKLARIILDLEELKEECSNSESREELEQIKGQLEELNYSIY